MFGTISCSSASVPRGAKSKVSSKNPGKSNFHQKKVRLDKFVGATFRSSTGCWGCRNRRKKCDETHPACNACVKRNIQCIWRTKGERLNRPHKINDYHVPKEGKPSESLLSCGRSPPAFENEQDHIESGSSGRSGNDNSDHSNIDGSGRYQAGLSNPKIETSLSDARNSHSDSPMIYAEVQDSSQPEIISDVIEISTKTTSLDLSPTRSSSLVPRDRSMSLAPQNFHFEPFRFYPPQLLPDFCGFLDSKGVSFVNHFDHKVSGALTVSPSVSNYFSKTFLLLAGIDEAVGHAIASWGAYYVHRSLHLDVEHHFGQAIGLIAKRFTRGVAVTKYDYFVLICFHLVLLGFFVCQGDASQWWICFKKCHELIKRFGGLEALCEEFNYLNDIKFLVSNFFYHDIMASHAFIHGPLIEVQQYARVFGNGFFDSSYGIDPLQGCLNPVYMLLAEELEVRTVMRSRKERLDAILNDELGTEDDPSILHEFDVMRTQYLEFCAEVQIQFETNIANCQIDHSLLSKTDLFELDVHLQTFELFKLVCKLYWVLFIKETSPTSNELQLLLIKLMDGIEKLVDSRMIVVLCLPLLVAGVASYTKHDRRRLEKIFVRIIANCPIQNVKKAWVVVKETWKRNSGGDKTLDWADVCEYLGWELCVC